MSAFDFEILLEAYDNWIRDFGIEWADERLSQKPDDVVASIQATYAQRMGTLFRSQQGLISEKIEPWYLPKTQGSSPRWSHARSQLGLSDEEVELVSATSDEILSRIADPKSASITTRGLVLGHVQSGKTTSFLSVAAKAADAGYTLIIILAGIHNSLRRQTQNRAARTLVHKRRLWWLGTVLGDFERQGNPLSSYLAGDSKRGLLVVKKNSTVLKKLADWLEEESDKDLRRQAILVIDDEADQAGLHVGSTDELEGVHKQLDRIVNLQTSTGERRSAYLAYTATPYANILTSQREDGLYPRDFIYPLDKPEAYVGPEELFGDETVGRPIVIDDDASTDLLTDGLRNAIRWFVLATAARAATHGPLESFHSSMMIHTTSKTNEQLEYRPLVEGWLRELAAEFTANEDPMSTFYAEGLRRVPARSVHGAAGSETAAPWSEVRVHVAGVLRRLIDRVPAGEPFEEDGHLQHAHSGVIVDNSTMDWKDRLTYSDLGEDEPSVTVIVIGGNTLSRGLTLEGLVCSYFARPARTYDTLIQMGRWFGYRPGYRHLVRVWMPSELLLWFRELNRVELDLRAELTWMQEHSLTPNRYGPRIRVTPHLNVTRAAAMRSAQMLISYSDRLIDPAWLDLEEDSLLHNQRLLARLAERIDGYDSTISPSKLFRHVPADLVDEVLFSYRFHDREQRLDLPSLRNYLSAEASRLRHWNVLFKSLHSSRTRYDFGGQVGEVHPVSRARLDTPALANIGSLVDSDDHRIDMGGSKPDGARFRSSDEPPLLVVYAIDPQSQPRGEERVNLGASTTPLGLSITLPKSSSVVEYVAPSLPSPAVDSLAPAGDNHD